MASERESKSVRVRVEPLPAWLDVERLLGPEFTRGLGPTEADCAEAELSPKVAAALSARLRGVGIDGSPLSVRVTPPLARPHVRAARLEDARARRETTRSFLRAGARASGEGRYSLTPEALAMRLAVEAKGRSVVDVCCGSGGNAVAFARAGCDVIAIDIDSERIAEAMHNAALYGVSRGIRFVQGDARQLLSSFAADILFVDPPWGLDYDKRATTRADFPLLEDVLSLPEQERARYGVIWIKLPASFATRSLPGCAARAVFGEERGDFRRIKFILATLPVPGSAP